MLATKHLQGLLIKWEKSIFSSRPMTVADRPITKFTTEVREQIVDQLRSCHTREQRLAFEKRFNCEADSCPLYLVICDFLHDRTISPALAAKWLRTLLDDRENQLRTSLNC